MRFLMKMSIPNETFNPLVRSGEAGRKIRAVMEALKPEAAYFAEMGGLRTGILIVNMDRADQIPSMAEPAFLALGAQVSFHPVMLPEDLAKSGLDQIGKAW